MKPKKKERALHDDDKSQFDKIQADHELFLQAFEKPTQIYRYLRSRNLISPVFLHRTLGYMKARCRRTANTRKTFKVDSILEKAEARHKKEQLVCSLYKSEYMNLTFLGFFDKTLSDAEVDVEVATYLSKVCHKKRKDASSPIMQVNLGTVNVICNPENASPSKATAVSVAADHFHHNNGHTVRSYVLQVKVLCHTRRRSPMCNGCGDAYDDEEFEPPAKRRRRSPSVSESADLAEPKYVSETRTYIAELVIYDKHRRCQLLEGEYELALREPMGTKLGKQKKNATWETVLDGKVVTPFEFFNKRPTLKFRLSWNVSPLFGSVDVEVNTDPLLLAEEDDAEFVDAELLDPKSPLKKARDALEALSPSKRKRIFYQFMYNNNTRQQTEAREDMHCPWCSLNCMHLYALVKHLRTSHARFIFIYTEHAKGARIDVSINDCYDGSYVGNPQDLHSHLGYAFSRNGPVRRTPVTHSIVYRPKKPVFDLIEFTEPEDEGQTKREMVHGHNRLYYRTVTCQPVRPNEIEETIEDSNDPIWLREKTVNLIDDFTDVNEGEKEVMKLWNLHIMHYSYIGDCQLARACMTFLQVHGLKLLRENLCRNFLLHVSSLFDFGLLRPAAVYQIMQQLHNLQTANGVSGTQMLNLTLSRRGSDAQRQQRLHQYATLHHSSAGKASVVVLGSDGTIEAPAAANGSATSTTSSSSASAKHTMVATGS